MPPDCFKGAFRSGGQWTPETLPMIHCYAFLKGTETLDDLKRRAEGHLGGNIPGDTWKVVIVRDVAPNKASMPRGDPRAEPVTMCALA